MMSSSRPLNEKLPSPVVNGPYRRQGSNPGGTGSFSPQVLTIEMKQRRCSHFNGNLPAFTGYPTSFFMFSFSATQVP